MKSKPLFKRIARLGSWLFVTTLIAGSAAAQPAQMHHSHDLKITVLVTNL